MSFLWVISIWNWRLMKKASPPTTKICGQHLIKILGILGLWGNILIDWTGSLSREGTLFN